MSRIKKEHGFTLVELSTGMVAGTILILTFASVLVLSRQETSAATRRVNALHDVWVVDEFMHNQLSKTMSDSVKIYADSTAEQSGSPASTGSILRAADGDGNSYRIAISNQTLNWTTNGLIHNPVDADVTTLSFSEDNSSSGKRITMGITLLSGGNTLDYEWIIAFRN